MKKKAKKVPMNKGKTLFTTQRSKKIKRDKKGEWETIDPLDDLDIGMGETYDWKNWGKKS